MTDWHAVAAVCLSLVAGTAFIAMVRRHWQIKKGHAMPMKNLQINDDWPDWLSTLQPLQLPSQAVTVTGGPPTNYTIVYGSNASAPAQTTGVVPLTFTGWWNPLDEQVSYAPKVRKPRAKRLKVQAVQTRRALALGGLPEK